MATAPKRRADRISRQWPGWYSCPLIWAALLAGCATPAPYQPLGDSETGYREHRIEDDRYLVTFRGNEVTSRETVETYLLYRAAELTLENGYDYFIVTDRETEAKAEGYVPVYGHYPYGHLGFGYHRFPYYAHGYRWGYARAYPADWEYQARAYILMRSGEKPEDDQFAYDARQVVSNLESEIVRSYDDDEDDD